jgi:hypothetical protein
MLKLKTYMFNYNYFCFLSFWHLSTLSSGDMDFQEITVRVIFKGKTHFDKSDNALR